ncbi:DapH/DapD/GlmU-related protein [Leuconostoc lactis]|uniref:DapH/DapD/GlmU-related protein n=1 Tax=Leuconostoc lactis TaxID=1246 RepID=UPI0028702C32|nr:DapH/DapD/GlmU-related protein [Leuconostoc lactis]
MDDNVWIGANVTILDGVHVSSGVVIGANTLVTKSISKNILVINRFERFEKTRN